MKAMQFLTSSVLGLAMAASAQISGVGYDANWNQISARLSLGSNAVDVGVGLGLNTADGIADNQKFGFSASGLFLGHMHDFGPVDTYFAAGGILAMVPDGGDPAGEDHEIKVDAFVGLQPEVTLMDHIAVGIRFGLHIPIAPDLKVQTAGEGISIVNGANFKILF
jgi:hypothetical protein